MQFRPFSLCGRARHLLNEDNFKTDEKHGFERVICLNGVLFYTLNRSDFKNSGQEKSFSLS